jgi:hypothetical protein
MVRLLELLALAGAPRLFNGSPIVLTTCCIAASSNSVLVPLTNSLYVKGELCNTESVLVDVGTGFLIEKVGSWPHFCSIYANV